MSGYGFTYRSTMCYPRLYCFKFFSNFHIHDKNIAFSLEFVSLRKKINCMLLSLIRNCKLSYLLVMYASTLKGTLICAIGLPSQRGCLF